MNLVLHQDAGWLGVFGPLTLTQFVTAHPLPVGPQRFLKLVGAVTLLPGGITC